MMLVRMVSEEKGLKNVSCNKVDHLKMALFNVHTVILYIAFDAQEIYLSTADLNTASRL